MIEEEWLTTPIPPEMWIAVKTDTDGSPRIGCTCRTGCCMSGWFGQVIIMEKHWRKATDVEIVKEMQNRAAVTDINWSDMYIRA